MVSIKYEVNLNDYKSHLFEVTTIISDLPSDCNEFNAILPVWTIGSYLIREFSRHIQEFKCYNTNQEKIRTEKIRKNAWKIQCNKNQKIILKYKVYAFDLTVRTSHLDDTHGFFNPPNLLMFFENESWNTRDLPLEVEIIKPEKWKIATSLKRKNDLDIFTRSGAFKTTKFQKLGNLAIVVSVKGDSVDMGEYRAGIEPSQVYSPDLIPTGPLKPELVKRNRHLDRISPIRKLSPGFINGIPTGAVALNVGHNNVVCLNTQRITPEHERSSFIVKGIQEDCNIVIIVDLIPFSVIGSNSFRIGIVCFEADVQI